MSYAYAPFKTDQQQIRLLHLEPAISRENVGPEKTRIRLRFETTNLHTAGDYTCLSYRWNDAGPTQTVISRWLRFSSPTEPL